MSKRFIISEEERSDIRSRYGLVNEQNNEKREYVRAIQRFLNEKLRTNLKIDGKTGDNSETSKAVMIYQDMINKKLGPYKNPLTVDGHFEEKTYELMPIKDKQRLDDLVAEEGGLLDQFTHWLGKMF
jgi:hypothetical protein